MCHVARLFENGARLAPQNLSRALPGVALRGLPETSDGEARFDCPDLPVCVAWRGIRTGQACDVSAARTFLGPVGHRLSRDEKLLASGGYDNTIILWDMASGRELRALGGHTDDVSTLAFSPDESCWPPAATTGPSSYGTWRAAMCLRPSRASAEFSSPSLSRLTAKRSQPAAISTM